MIFGKNHKNEAQILNVKYEIPFKEFGGITALALVIIKGKLII